MEKILIIKPKSWEETVFLKQKLSGYVFRGQADSQWGLSTRLERVCWQNYFPTDFLKNREDIILYEFRRRAHHFIRHLPKNSDRLEWLALMQHYGGSTRLLDFTRSFYIATFFATESTNKDAAVWAVHDDYLYQHTNNIIGENETILNLEERSRNVVNKCLSGKYVKCTVMMAVPERLNERNSIQQGCFLIPGDINKLFEVNLSSTLDIEYNAFININKAKVTTVDQVVNVECFDNPLIKIILPVEIHNKIQFELFQMNVNAATLFPGLEGFARSLNHFLRDVV